MLGELQLVEKKISGCNPAVPGNDEISTSVSWRVTRAARYPLDPPAIAYFLGLGYWLISKVRVSSLDRARDSIDLVAASVDASLGIVEHAIFGEDLVYRGAPTRRVVLTEDIVKIAGQQGRYAVEHGFCFHTAFLTGKLARAHVENLLGCLPAILYASEIWSDESEPK